MANFNNYLTKKANFNFNFALERLKAKPFSSLNGKVCTTLLKSFLLIPVMMISIPEKSDGQDSGKQFRVYWENGLNMMTEDEEVTLSIGGRLQHDWAFISKDRELEAELGEGERFATGFRRIRFFQDGSVGSNFQYKLQLDFAGGAVKVKDVYLHMSDIPVIGNIRVGHQKEFFSMEQIASSNDVVFMERSLGDLFIPTRNPGVTVFDHYWDGRLTWGAGLYRSADGFGNPGQTTQGNYNLTGRMVGMPWRKDDAHLLVLGSSFSRRDPDNDEVVFQADPESRLAGEYIQTGLIKDVTVNLVSNYSISAVYGPLSIQGEYMASRPRGEENMLFSGYYGQLSYFLTGDNRNYEPTEGSYGSVIPQNNFNLQEENGTGAIELAVRYSTLDLNDQMNSGGEIADLTGGVNWYLNPNSRIMFNYVLANVEGSGKSNIFQTRFQVTF